MVPARTSPTREPGVGLVVWLSTTAVAAASLESIGVPVTAVPASPVSAVLSTSAVMFTASAAVALPEHSARVIAIVLVADPAIDRKCVVAPVPMIAAAE